MGADPHNEQGIFADDGAPPVAATSVKKSVNAVMSRARPRPMPLRHRAVRTLALSNVQYFWDYSESDNARFPRIGSSAFELRLPPSDLIKRLMNAGAAMGGSL
jgi:hypothetical protein